MPPRVLLVDDDDAVVKMFTRALELDGFEVWSASSPLDGLRRIEKAQPDAILLDLQMPFVNGLGFLYRLRTNPETRDIPVVVITGNSAMKADTIAELADLGVEVRFKPMEIRDLLDVTRGLVASHGRHRDVITEGTAHA